MLAGIIVCSDAGYILQEVAHCSQVHFPFMPVIQHYDVVGIVWYKVSNRIMNRGVGVGRFLDRIYSLFT
jgi:hypothetical protein